MTVALKSLDEESLIRILKEPRNALTKQYTKLFEIDGVKLKFTDEALQAIAHRAVTKKTGARGLRSILESVMMNIMYEIPSDPTIDTVTITKECVENGSDPVVSYVDGRQGEFEKDVSPVSKLHFDDVTA